METLVILLMIVGLATIAYFYFKKDKPKTGVHAPSPIGGEMCRKVRFEAENESNYLVVELCDGSIKTMKVEEPLELCIKNVKSSTAVDVIELGFC